MTDDRTLERAARSWLEEGPTRAPDRPVEAALTRIQTTRQERDLRIPWRIPTMTSITRIAVVAATLAVAVGAVFLVIRPPSNIGPAPSASATPPPPSIEGTWDAEFTHQQLIDAGLVDAAEDNPENWGHFRMIFTDRGDGTGGAFHITQLDGPGSSGGGTYSVAGSTLTIHCSGWCDTDAVFVLSFSLTPTTLTIAAPGPTTFHVEPWVRVGEPAHS